MKRKRFWNQIQNRIATTLSSQRVRYSFFLGIIFSWFTKGLLTPIIFGGKNFAGRSEWIQVTIVVFLTILYTGIFICFSPIVPSSIYLKLNEEIFKPILAGCRDTLLEMRGILESFIKPRKLLNKIQGVFKLPDLYWIFGSYLAAYFMYFILPVFLNSGQRMWLRLDYYANTPIGGDLRWFLLFGKAFFAHHGEYPPGNVYPPLFTLLISPFASIELVSVYKFLVPLIFLSYLLITLVIPGLIVRNKKGFLLLAAFFFTGLFSYGFLFEMERGQTNVIAFLFILTAIYLFHYKPRLRILAYMLFSVGAQIKISPAIFIFMLIDNWKDWKTNIKRFAGLGVFNAILLFVLGYQSVFVFLSNLQTVNFDFAGKAWIGNHSIKSFTFLLQAGHFREVFSGIHFLAGNAWAMENAPKIGILLTMVILLCFVIMLFSTYKRNTKGFNPHLFVISTLMALLIPAISQDYTLSILGSAVGLTLAMNLDSDVNPNYCVFRHLLVALITFAYSTVLYTYEYKPLFLQSNLPALITMLICFTILALLPKPAVEPINHPLNDMTPERSGRPVAKRSQESA